MAETEHGRPRAIRVVLADDHVLLRQGLQSLLDAEPDLEVVGQAGSGDEAIACACTLLPDVVVMDVSMPNGDGIRATAKIRSTCPAVRILGLSRHLDPGYVRRLLSAGASGYVVKRATAVELVQAVRAVAAGDTYLDAAVAPLLAEHQRDALRGAIGGTALTARETEVLRLIARGRSNRDIAQRSVSASRRWSTTRPGVLPNWGCAAVPILCGMRSARDGWTSERSFCTPGRICCRFSLQVHACS